MHRLNNSIRSNAPISIFVDEQIDVDLTPALQTALLPASDMEVDEFNEKHLQDALERKSSHAIPIPDVITIDEEIYDRMYPANFKMPRGRIVTVYDESDVCDYDLDDEDERWLNQIPQQYRPSNSAFERGIAFLERSANKKVPTFLEFRAQIFVENEKADLVYDYWIDRRLKTKEKLTFLVKTKESSRKHKDPYVAFRPCVEKMTTRKNRANDYQEYLKMLKVRRDLANDLKFWQEVKHEQATKHCWLKQMACIFESQYHSENFEMDQPQPCFDAWDRQEMSLEETSNVTETLSEVNDTETHFDFKRNADSEYFKPIDAWNITSDPTEQKFFKTSSGFMRQRMGRGGRIVIDRRKSNFGEEQPEQEYKLCSASLVVNIGRSGILRNAGAGSSQFTLQNYSMNSNPFSCNSNPEEASQITLQ